MALAGFTVGEAEGLRRAMSRKRSEEAIEALRPRFVEGALRAGRGRGARDTRLRQARRLLRLRLPEVALRRLRAARLPVGVAAAPLPSRVLCALLNAQPMGFYPPASLVRDGQRRGVEVRPPDVNLSAATCAIEEDAVRIGLGYVRSVGEEEAKAVAGGSRTPTSPISPAARR